MVSLEFPPLKLKSNTSIMNLYSRETNAVAVRYCVLRPQKKNNS